MLLSSLQQRGLEGVLEEQLFLKDEGIVTEASFALIIIGLFFKGSGASINYGCS